MKEYDNQSILRKPTTKGEFTLLNLNHKLHPNVIKYVRDEAIARRVNGSVSEDVDDDSLFVNVYEDLVAPFRDPDTITYEQILHVRC